MAWRWSVDKPLFELTMTWFIDVYTGMGELTLINFQVLATWSVVFQFLDLVTYLKRVVYIWLGQTSRQLLIEQGQVALQRKKRNEMEILVLGFVDKMRIISVVKIEISNYPLQ